MTDAEFAKYPHGNVTIVFTDVEKSTDMTRRLGRQGVYEEKLQTPHRVRLMAEAQQRGGFEIQRAGDGHMIVFQRAADALACVVAFQQSLLADPITHREGTEDFTILVRVGVHTPAAQIKPKLMENGRVEYPGEDTAFAFRVMNLGQGGQILISGLATVEAENSGRYRLHPWRNRLLQSFTDKPHAVHELLYDPDQQPREPGMQWLPEWYQAEKKLYIERPGKELEVVQQFMREAASPANAYAGRSNKREGPRVVTIKASGGMGKTRLAVACAAKVADLFPDGIYFVPLVDVSLPTEEAIAEAIGRALGLRDKDTLPANVLEYLRPKTVLLILDNFESVLPPTDDPDPKVALYLARLIGQAHGLRLLVTGRSLTGIPDIEKQIDIDAGMQDDEALALFLDRARLKWSNDRVLTPDELIQWDRIRILTDKIPLAIELAAAWVGRYKLAAIADGLQSTPLGPQTALRPGEIRFDTETTHGRHDSLTRSLDWSYNLLGKTAGPATQALFAACGLFVAPFDAPTLAIVTADPTAEDHLFRLLDASLVRFVDPKNPERYHLHHATREYASQRLANTPTADATRRRFVDHYVRLVQENATDPNNARGYELLDLEWPNALAAAQIAEKQLADTSSVRSIYAVGEYLRLRGLWSEAEKFYLQCQVIVQTNFDLRNEGVVWNSLGIVREAQGRYDEAIDAYQRSLDIDRQLKDRVGEGRTLNNIGGAYQLQGRYDEAIDAYNGSLVIQGEFKDRVGEGQTLNNMGIVYRIQGRYDEAIDAYNGSLVICREFKDRVGEGRTLNNIGGAYQLQGRYDEAIDAYNGSLVIRREFKDRVGEGQTLNNMGTVYQLQGRYDEAIDAYNGSLVICREFKDRVGEGQTLNNMGTVYRIQGRYEKAIDAYNGSLVIKREFKDRVGEGQTLNNMGTVYKAQGRYDEAIDAYNGSLVIQGEFKDRVGEGQTLNNMGIVYEAQGRYDEAIDAYNRSLVIRREFKDRVGEGQTLNNMGIVYKAQGRYDEAIAAYNGSLVIQREFKDRVGEGRTLGNLALLEEARGRVPEAINWARQAVAVFQNTEARLDYEKARQILERLEDLA